jgi:H+/Cl- antiporter ClcA
MNKILFLPFSAVSGIIAGLIGNKLFATVWSALDDEEPPDPKRREVPWLKVVIALLLKGAIVGAVRAIADRASRVGFSKLTGSWPGEESKGQAS